jgi:putative peptidoglycan lipid II flippase
MTDRRGVEIRGLLIRFLPQGGLVLAILIFGSYVLGYVRDKVFALTFGASAELDAYNAAFVLPELTLDVLVASGLAAPFIPIFLRLRRTAAPDPSAANEFAQTIFTGAVGLMTLAAGLLFILAPQTTAIIAPGFSGEQRDLYVGLFRVMLVTPILFAASLTIVLGTLAFSGPFGIFGAAIGAALGALLHLGIRLWGLRGSTFHVAPRLRNSRSVGEFVRLMLPKMASHPVEPMTFLFFTAVATGLGAGSVSAVSFARNFQSVPVSVIGVAFALAAFPALSAAWAAGERRTFTTSLLRDTLTIAGLTGLAAVLLYLLSGLLIETLLGGGAFDAADVALTSMTLAAFALSVPFESLTHLLSRAIYATRHTLFQVVASLVSFGVTVLASAVLIAELGIIALPIGFAIGNALKVLLLAVVLAWRLRR